MMRCANVQLDAGPLVEGALFYDVEADLVAELERGWRGDARSVCLF
jgi:hypothetical protein